MVSFAEQDFNTIRADHKISTDVSQMTAYASILDKRDNLGSLTYSKDTKACIPQYNIKAAYN